MQSNEINFPNLALDIKAWGKELGFDAVGITDTHLDEHETYLLNWLDNKFNGEMHYMSKHGTKRSQPAQLVALHLT